MLIVGLQGSPRPKGNTGYLLSSFLNEAKKLGAQTHLVDVSKKNILPCRGCGHCEKHGFCVIEDDDMKSDIYPLLRSADIIVAATPIFFYGATAQLKTLIDRTQALWSRKYSLKLRDPFHKHRKGFLLSLAASKGKNLFLGVELTVKYFFDAVSADFYGSLTYRQIEKKGDMEKYPTVLNDIKSEVKELLKPFLSRKKILFACRENACRSQMASAFAQHFAGDKIEALSGGSNPANQINPVMQEVMEEKGIDMAFRSPRSMDDVISEVKPDMIISMGCNEECPFITGVEMKDWSLPDPAGKSIEFMRNIRNEIEKNVLSLIDEQNTVMVK
ncbi:arsenate reductase (thioredoxin) [Candidatus Magnetomoraceae bacterium gMMP-15]